MAEKRKPRKSIPGRPEPRSKTEPSIILKPSVENLLNDTIQIMAYELARYRAKVESGEHLDLKQARVIQGYAKCLTDLSSEAREHEKHNDLSDLKDEDLIRVLKGEVDVENKNGTIAIITKEQPSD